jgi:prephenate dehydrogenase
MPGRALIVGLGLIGGAAGLALRSRGWHVAYVDPYVDDPGQAADERLFEIEGEHDVVVIATPVDVAVALVGREAARSRGREVGREAERSRGRENQPRDPATSRPIITSLCSVMLPLRNVGSANFVAGHPLAGSEKRGLAAARPDLFEGKRWFVDRDDDVVDAVIRDCGAVKVLVDAAEHDAAMALTSHLPQLLSTALAAAMADEHLGFAGGGLETFLRLAGSDASVWAPILAANRDNIRAHFDRVVAIAHGLIDGDPYEAFQRANEVHRRLTPR